MHGSLPGLAAGRFGVIMFFSACRLPSFAPEDPPSHASGNQITTGYLVSPPRSSWKHELNHDSMNDFAASVAGPERGPVIAHSDR